MKPILIKNLSRLHHFNAQGIFTEYNDISLMIDEKGCLKFLGKESNLPPLLSDVEIIQGNHLLGLPLFIDSHTHSLFAGNRAHEFLLKMQGMSYSEISAQGGGIIYTQQKTQQTGTEDLKNLLKQRLQKLREQGVLGVEVKSGYGLTHKEEIRHLEIINEVKNELKGQMQIWVTYMGPHAVLKDTTKEKYLEEIINKTLPEIAQKKLAQFVDIFIDEGFFNVQDARNFFHKATKLGFSLKAHIDEIKNLGAARLCEEFTLTSVDHCLHTSLDEFKKLVQKKVSIVFLPMTSFYLNEKSPSMDDLRVLGINPAIALDYNPGSQPSLSVPLLMQMAFRRLRMQEQEVLEAMTINSLKAVGCSLDLWCLELGKPVRFSLFQAESIAELGYRYGENLCKKIFFYS